MKNIKQNLFFACVYNTLGVRIAAVGLLLSTIAAAAANSFSSFSAVGMRCGFTTNSSVEEGQRQWFVSFLLLASSIIDDHGQVPGFAAQYCR